MHRPATTLRLAACCAAWSALAHATLAQSGTSGPASYENGVVGMSLSFEFTGTPNATGLWLLALAPGPTPLPCTGVGLPPAIEPSLGASIVLEAFVHDLAGSFTSNLPVPAAPVLAGLDVYAQGLELDAFATCLVAGVSNPLRFGLLPAMDSILTIGEMVVPRRGHGFSLLPNGRALLSGGENPDPGNPFPLASLETYDPLREEFQLLPLVLPEARARHVATELADGRVLLTGGIGAGGAVLASAVLFDPSGPAIVALPPMAAPRVHHQATLLSDGRVLVTGGIAGPYNAQNAFGFPASFPSTLTPNDTLATVPAELFDPVTLTWSQVGPSPSGAALVARMGHRASLLKSGFVLITGGAVFQPGTAKFVESDRQELWDPTTGALNVSQDPNLARVFHAQIAKAKGGVLITAGGKLAYDALSFQLQQAQLPSLTYDPPAMGSALGPQSIGPTPHDPSPLAEIICVPVGRGNFRYYEIACPDPPPWGQLDAARIGTPSQTVYRFEPLTNSWVPVAQLVHARPGHASLHFASTNRAVTTGSAWPTPLGTVGLDRTAEVYTLP